MTRTEVVCIHCRGIIRHHWQLIHLHATCTRPILEQAVRAIQAPPGEEGPAALTWCEPCQQYHIAPHAHQLGRHARRKITQILRKW